MKAMNLFDNDCYIRLDIIYGLKDLRKTGKRICTNQTVPFTRFFKDLMDHEAQTNTSGMKRYGVTLTIMLDKRRSKEEMIKITEKFAQHFNNLPYYAYSKKIGKGNFLVIYFCERHYFPEGKEWPVLATSDRYMNQKTGRMCSKDDPEAKLLYKKGQPTRKKVFSKFSNKELFFKYANKDEFKYQMGKLKMFTVSVLAKECDADIPRDLSIKKYNVKKRRMRFQKRNAAVWNRAIAKMENMLADALNGMKLTKTYTDENIAILKNLRDQYQEILNNQSFKYKRFEIIIRFSRRYQYAVEDSLCLIEKFTQSLNNTMQVILG